MKLAQKDYNVIFSMAKQNFIDLDRGKLDESEFIAYCWAKAFSSYFKLNWNVE